MSTPLPPNDAGWETIRSPTSTTPSTASKSTLPKPSSLAPTPKARVSFFELHLLFCDTAIINSSYYHDPVPFRQNPNCKVTIIFHLDRENSRESNQANLWDLITYSNPRLNEDKRCGDKVWINAFAVGPGVRLSSAGVIAQLWEMETEGSQVVVPDLFGWGNELQVIVRPRD